MQVLGARWAGVFTCIRARPGETPVAHSSVNTSVEEAEAGSVSLTAEFSAPGSW